MSNSGVKFEKDIVECKNNPRPNFGPKVQNAVKLVTSVFPNQKAIHRDSVSLKGMNLGAEIKADFWFGEIGANGTSVKLDGAIQLSSAQGENTAKAFQLCYEKIRQQLTDSERDAIEYLISMVDDIPTKMVSAANLLKASQRKPQDLAVALNYDMWFKYIRPVINAYMSQVFRESPQFKLAVVEEMLTGRLQFANTIGIADYILTPNYYGYVDKKYVQKIADCVKIDVRGKSRGGITAGVVRFDAKA